MRSTSAIVALVGAVLLIMGCGQQAAPPPTVDEAFTTLKEAFGETESSQDKARLAEEFLAAHPDSEYSGTIADVLAYYLGEALGEKERAYSLIDAAYAQVTEPEWRFEVGLALYPLAHELGKTLELATVVAELTGARALTYSENLRVTELALGHDQWEVAESHATEALGQATETAYRADYPDSELSADEIATKVSERRERALLSQGWAMANLDRLDEAQATLAAAADLSTTNYLGVAKTEVNTYWGRTMLMAGDAERAMELLAADAVMGDRDEALAALREAYAIKNGGDEGFDEYLWSTRLQLARTLDAFTLPDYDGESHEISGGNGEVLLLAFWFPT